MKGAAKDKLEAGKESAFFCQHMAQLVCDIPLDPPLKDIELFYLPADQILNFFQEVNFNMLSRRFKEFGATPFGTKLMGESFAVPTSPEVPEKNQLSLF